MRDIRPGVEGDAIVPSLARGEDARNEGNESDKVLCIETFSHSPTKPFGLARLKSKANSSVPDDAKV